MSGAEEQTELLRSIWNELKTINGRVNTTNGELAKLREETHAGFADVRSELADVRRGLTELRTEMHDGFVGVDARIDRPGDIAGVHIRDLRERVARFEVLAGVTVAR